jgi:hypothetical protein
MNDYLNLIDEASHLNHLADAESPIIINGLKRTCDISETFNREVAIVGDHRSNLITFHGDRIIDGHDTLNCALAVIKWENSSAKKSGAYVIDDRQILESDPNKIVFHWAVESETTIAAGPIKFSICFVDYNEFGDQVIYRWNTRPCVELTIGEGIYVPDIDTPITNNDGSFLYNGAVSIV